MLGVISGVRPPKQPGESQLISSAVIKRIFVRLLDLLAVNTGLCPYVINATPSPIAFKSEGLRRKASCGLAEN